MSDVKLSICIPTYNRADFLRNALSYCLRDFDFEFPYEIVISDNASTDDTGQVAAEFREKGLPIQYYRRRENGGSGPNLVSAFHHARGENIVYLADDDILIAPQLANVVSYLDAHPDVGVVHAPWLLYNEVEEKPVSQFYQLARDVTFARGEFAEAFDFLFSKHIFPEIAVFRASMLRSAWIPRNQCFWAFSYLSHFLTQGAVTFMKEPFYRFTTTSIVGNRSQTGNNDVMTFWDKYRGGLEYFIHMGMKQGNIPDTPTHRLRYEEKCRIFALNRMAVGIRLWLVKKDFITAYELYTRMSFGGMDHHPELTKIKDTLPLLVGVQTLAWHVNCTADVERLLLRDVANPASIEELLRDLGLSESIEVIVDTGVHHRHDPEMVERTAVLFADEGDREKLMALGYKPGLLFKDAELMRHTVM